MNKCDLITRDGYDYSFDPSACHECRGNCCNGESGNVWISDEEILKLAEYKSISTDKLKELYFRQKDGRWSILELKINNNYSCVFFDADSNACSIYSCRPKQCKDFPFWEYYKTRFNELKKECPAVNFRYQA